jgi:hypothetical protein
VQKFCVRRYRIVFETLALSLPDVEPTEGAFQMTVNRDLASLFRVSAAGDTQKKPEELPAPSLATGSLLDTESEVANPLQRRLSSLSTYVIVNA